MSGGRPKYRIQAPVELGQDRTIWVQCGAVWPAKEGDSLNVEITSLPFGATRGPVLRLVLVPVREDEGERHPRERGGRR